MSDIMKPIPFGEIIEVCLQDYYTKGKIFEIDAKYFIKPANNNLVMNFNNEFLRFPIGPAAGPHTQLCQNILSAYLTGSRFFELKTVQTVDGDEMRKMVPKPCIDAKNVGYNVEWSTELTVEKAKNEYIKASLLLQLFGIELGISDVKDFAFNMSVGYSLEGIKSKKISDFIDDLKDANDTPVFKECIETIKKNLDNFKRFNADDINKLSSNISSSVTLSTMHGSKPEEIFDIASHLIVDKKLNTFIKCNPTLLGYDKVREILDLLGYNDVVIRKEDFEKDLQFDKAVEIISKLIALGRKNGVNVGIKLTNTLPVVNTRNVLSGESMYLSGKPLYPIALGVASMFAEAFDGKIHISMSGGIDRNNISYVLKTGIAPVTFSTVLLKPRGFLNTKSMLDELGGEHFSFDKLDVKAIKELAEAARTDKNYKNKGDGRLLEDTLPTFDCFKVNCGICVDVCPNRANARVYDEHFDSPYQILHFENRCYECGNCHTFCTRGGFPYFTKPTLYKDMDEFVNSRNPGFVKIGENKFKIRDEKDNKYIYEINTDRPNEEKRKMEIFLETVVREYPYLFNV